MSAAEKILQARPTDPRRRRCGRCGEEVVHVYLAGGRTLLVDHPEVSGSGDIEPGLYIAVDALGDARPVRWPGALASGEALHLPHQLSCQGPDA